MRALVSGGAGLVGSAMCGYLLDRGDEVICVDNFLTGSPANVEALLERDGMHFVQADIRGELPDVGPLDAVFNLACPASPVDFDRLSLEIMEIGSRGVANLLDLALRNDARFLQASTSEVYGEPLVHPQPETYWGNVNPVGPRSVYDEAKRFGEALTMAHHRRHGTKIRIARIFNTYGPRMRPDDGRLVSHFVTAALAGQPLTIYGDGTQTRSFCYVDDEVAGLVSLLLSDHLGPVNVGNDEERSVHEMAELIVKLTGSPSEVVFEAARQDDPTQRRPDLTIARETLGWEPKVPLEEGLRHTIEWFRTRMAA
ncbi:MAG TPA: UDP-glucuronic acid decarboxylase family protein [Acidimicrobiales bacterium]|jgi:dTDP-glucose 4,6-dehydratase|nr:UDP-glucuronic acid decarboxylase family protein [Acidimicrobiales bacterium]